MKRFEEKTIKTESIFKGKVIDLQVDDVELPNGKTSKRELVKHPGAVAIIARTDEGKVIMVEQYRKPLEKSIIEIPAGKLEAGENPEETAKRELAEETGYEADELSFVVSYYTSPGFADEKLYVYEAKGLKLSENRLDGDEDEFVDLVEVTLEEAKQMIKQERIHDAKTIHAIYYLLLDQLNYGID
ncbi:ADP-ribose pyrophosphatase [Halalkalibacillus sediminis]|uniref:ADP-ribose pyrophosphatase n=1 Tax=Halalkalibacillus sediminis TaxID=2018042 RepID=A0A2I0QX64_9BACI|nr:NUDIX hydrolase [Halalkalibacillus sediminis]PKR78914.1 ADP-ribose pyrophosphatase [Halalkalibacillus sediminis]